MKWMLALSILNATLPISNFSFIFADARVYKKQNEKTRLMMDVLIVLNGQHAESNDYFLGNDR